MKTIFWDFDATLGYNEGKWTGTATDLINREYPDHHVVRDDIRPSMSDGRFPWHNPEVVHPGQTADDWWAVLMPMLVRAYRKAGVEEDIAAELAGMFRAEYLNLETWHVFDDTIPCLSELKDLGWKHYILSNHVPELPDIVEHLGLAPYFEEVSTSAASGYEKPHPEAYRQLLRRLPDNSTVWMIGDNIKSDILGAEAVGIPAILVRSKNVDAKYSFLSLSEVARFIENTPCANRLETDLYFTGNSDIMPS